MGIQRNPKSDSVAKSVLVMVPDKKFKISYPELKTKFNKSQKIPVVNEPKYPQETLPNETLFERKETNPSMYLPTPPLGQDVTQDQFLSGV